MDATGNSRRLAVHDWPGGMCLELLLMTCCAGPALAEMPEHYENYRDAESTISASPLVTLSVPGVQGIEYSRDGKLLASWSWENVSLWEAGTLKKTHTLPRVEHSFTNAFFSPCGRYLVTGAADEPAAKIWDTTTGLLVRTLTWEDKFTKIEIVRDGKINIAMTTSGFRRRSMARGAFSSDGKQLATPGCRLFSIGIGMPEPDLGDVRLWDMSTGEEIRTLRGHAEEALAVGFSPDGKHLASGGRDGHILVWELGKGKPILSIRDSRSPITRLAYSPDGGQLAVAGAYGPAKVWTLSELLAPEGKSSNRDAIKFELRVNRDQITTLSWSPNGKYLATVAGYQGDATDDFSYVAIWDGETGKQLVNLGSGDRGRPGRGVGFSPDGMRLATAHIDGTVKIWSLAALMDRKLTK